MPRGEQCCLALGREARRLRSSRPARGPHARCLPAAGSGGRRRGPRVTSTRSAGERRVGDPERQLTSALHDLAGRTHQAQMTYVHSGCRTTGLEQLPPGNALVRRVERATDLALAELDHPGAEVADVDELRRSLGRRGRQHLAATHEAVRPIREPASRTCGPTMNPGRTTSARPSKDSTTTSSHSALSGP